MNNLRNPQSFKFDLSTQSLLSLLQRFVLIALGVTVAAHTSKGISYENIETLVVVVLVLSFLNLVIKPFLMLFALPFIIFTFGLGILFINAFLMLFVSKLVVGFHVNSFGSALWGALVISLTTLVVNVLLSSQKNRSSGGGHSNKPKINNDDDVIDI